MSGLPDRPMPTRSGARQRAVATKCGITLRQTNEDVGLPWRKTIGGPLPASRYETNVSRISRLRVVMGALRAGVGWPHAAMATTTAHLMIVCMTDRGPRESFLVLM